MLVNQSLSSISECYMYFKIRWNSCSKNNYFQVIHVYLSLELFLLHSSGKVKYLVRLFFAGISILEFQFKSYLFFWLYNRCKIRIDITSKSFAICVFCFQFHYKKKKKKRICLCNTCVDDVNVSLKKGACYIQGCEGL